MPLQTFARQAVVTWAAGTSLLLIWMNSPHWKMGGCSTRIVSDLTFIRRTNCTVFSSVGYVNSWLQGEGNGIPVECRMTMSKLFIPHKLKLIYDVTDRTLCGKTWKQNIVDIRRAACQCNELLMLEFARNNKTVLFWLHRQTTKYLYSLPRGYFQDPEREYSHLAQSRVLLILRKVAA